MLPWGRGWWHSSVPLRSDPSPPQVQAGVRMLGTRLVALIPTVLMAVAFEATNTFDLAAQVCVCVLGARTEK